MQLLLPHNPRKSTSLAELFRVHLLWKIQSDMLLSSHTWCSKAYFVLRYSVLIWCHKDVVYSMQMRNSCSPSYCFEFPDSCTYKNLNVFYLTFFFFSFSFCQSINPWVEASHIRISVGMITNKHASRKTEDAQRANVLKQKKTLQMGWLSPLCL